MKLIKNVSISDPFVKDWLLMNSVIWTVLICIVYFLLSKIVLPRLMKNRAPLEIKNIIIIYNVVQVLANIYLTVNSYLAARTVTHICDIDKYDVKVSTYIVYKY